TLNPFGSNLEKDSYLFHVAFARANPGIIENSSGAWRGDLQEQRGTFESRGQAAYRGWAVRLAGKRGWAVGALFFWASKGK
ncbi:MAG: hypothetical protein MJA30_36955, partial [Cytophagales bacterium]|nr:hypothetical protein [Cytophagales bacterium]